MINDSWLKWVTDNQGQMGMSVNECRALMDICKKFRPKISIETGRRHGTSTRVLAQGTSERLISIEPNPKAAFDKQIKQKEGICSVEMIKGSIPWIKPFSSDLEVDLLYIDGDHDFCSVIVDYHYLNYYLRQGGVISFHDYTWDVVKYAVDIIIRRDNLKFLSQTERLVAFEKTLPAKETFFNLRTRKIYRGKLTWATDSLEKFK